MTPVYTFIIPKDEYMNNYISTYLGHIWTIWLAHYMPCQPHRRAPLWHTAMAVRHGGSKIRGTCSTIIRGFWANVICQVTGDLYCSCFIWFCYALPLRI